MTEPTLSAEEAEQWVEQRVETYGLGALPKVHVTALSQTQWRIQWSDRERVASPMTQSQWAAWIEENVGEVTEEGLVSTEG